MAVCGRLLGASASNAKTPSFARMWQDHCHLHMQKKPEPAYVRTTSAQVRRAFLQVSSSDGVMLFSLARFAASSCCRQSRPNFVNFQDCRQFASATIYVLKTDESTLIDWPANCMGTKCSWAVKAQFGGSCADKRDLHQHF